MQTTLRTQAGQIAALDNGFFNKIGQKRTYKQKEKGAFERPLIACLGLNLYLKYFLLTNVAKTISMDNVISAQVVKVGTDVVATGGLTGRTVPPVHDP